MAAIAITSAAYSGGAKPQADPPTDVIFSRHLAMALFRPDPAIGYYRGARFDWSGIVERVEYKGHRIFTPYKPERGPKRHDRVGGPSEEFGMAAPLAYDVAGPGDYFIKIGVGHVLKKDNQTYGFWKHYEAVPALWNITRGSNTIEYKQEVFDVRGWCYQYTKTIELDEQEAAFTINHSLKNTGWKTIDTTHYNHGFFIVDDEPIGPDYTVTFPFDVSLKQTEKMELAGVRTSGRTVSFEKPIKSIWSEVDGGLSVDDNAFTVTHAKSGMSIDVKGDKPVHKFNIWSDPSALCPEPFIRVKAAPDETFEWKIKFTFRGGTDQKKAPANKSD